MGKCEKAQDKSLWDRIQLTLSARHARLTTALFENSKTQANKLRITIMATESWNNITEGETNLSGKFSINSNGLKWQSNDSEEKPVELPSSELAGAQITWLNARPKCQLRVLRSQNLLVMIGRKEQFRFLGGNSFGDWEETYFEKKKSAI